jgi:hypothetical protein
MLRCGRGCPATMTAGADLMWCPVSPRSTGSTYPRSGAGYLGSHPNAHPMCKQRHVSWREAPTGRRWQQKVLSHHPQGGVFAHFGTKLLRFVAKLDSVIHYVTRMNWERHRHNERSSSRRVPAQAQYLGLHREFGSSQTNGLALSDQVWAEQVELESPDDVGDAGLAGSAGREVAGFLGLAGAGPVRAVAGEGSRGEDLEQERGEREIGLLRGKKPRPCPSRRPGRAGS